MNKGNTKNNLRTIETVYQITWDKFNRLLELFDKSNVQRAATLFSFGAVILSIVFSIYLREDIIFSLFLIGVLLIFGSLLMSLIAIVSWRFRGDPEPKALFDNFLEEDYETVLRQVTSNLIEAYEYNKEKIQIRGAFVDWGFITIILGLISLALSILI